MAQSRKSSSTYRVGVLNSLTGVMCDSEKLVVEATRLALEEINSKGGVLGREIIPIIRDGASRADQFAEQAKRLLGLDEIKVIFGCWTSASRKALLPVLRDHDGILFYPVQYEGLEESPNVIYTGSTLNQQIEPAVDWAVDQGWRKAAIVGSDYVFPRTANTLMHGLSLQVEDTGIGISPEAQKQLFQPFAQADSGVTRKYGGTGLGLVICQRLVDLMGGRLKLDSVLGRGTRFTVQLPLPLAEKVKVGQALPHQLPPAGLLEGKRALLVDDNRVNLRVAKGMLQAMGISVVEVSDAKQAQQLLTSRQEQANLGFDAMIFDAMMPEIDGRELARWVKTLENGKRVPLILASSGIGRDTERHGTEFNLFKAILAKPLRRSTLARALAAAIANWQPVKPQPPTSPVQSRRALVVEDGLVNQKIARGMLEKGGHQVTIAENGQQALELVTDPNIFDLILMDVQMPVLDGLETTRRIRQREQDYGWPRWPVIALTGNAMQKEQEECLTAGMDGCMTKPLNMKEVQALVAETPVRS